MNLPNILTTARFFFAYVMVYFIFKNGGEFSEWALVLFLVASLTDYWDGRYARKHNLITDYGSLMDPIADKALTLCAFVSFWKLDLIPGIWVAVVAAREVSVTGFRLYALGQGKVESAGSSGKIKTVLQMVYISGVLSYIGLQNSRFWQPSWESPAVVLIYGGMLGVVGMTLASGLETFWKRKRV